MVTSMVEMKRCPAFPYKVIYNMNLEGFRIRVVNDLSGTQQYNYM